jgi:hypothetical protein
VPSRICLLAICTVLTALGTTACAQETLLPREKHPWGRYSPGSWKRMRLTTETYDQHGVATASISEIKTTIKTIDAKSYTLLTEEMVGVGGSSLLKTAREATFGFSGENSGQKVEVKKIGDSELVLNGRKIPCEVRQVVMNGEGAMHTTATAYYSADVTPHVLRKEQTTSNGSAAEPATSTEEVVALGMPYDVLGQRRTVAFVHTVHKVAAKSKVTMEVCCDEVPGGIVARWSKELDADGKLIVRTTLELVDYHVEKPGTVGPAVRPRLFDRKRARRADEKMGSTSRRHP